MRKNRLKWGKAGVNIRGSMDTSLNGHFHGGAAGLYVSASL